MKGFFTELGATLIMLLALTGMAKAQLIGLPQYGVTLSGTLASPVMENHSTKTVIGHVLRLFYTGSDVPLNASALNARGIWMHWPGNESAEGLQPNQTEAPLDALSHVRMGIRGNDLTGKTPYRVVLDSVMFSDGQFVGPDAIQNFAKISTHIAALHELATQASQARLNPSLQDAFWAEVSRLSVQRGLSEVDRWKTSLAFDFRWAHSHNADTDAYTMADRVLALPTPWRIN